MSTTLKFWLECLLEIFFPKLCLVCEDNVPPYGEYLCTNCLVKIARSDLHLERENDFTERLHSRVPLHTGAAMYLYKKGSGVQKIIHAFKYGGQRQLGFQLARRYGWMLADQAHFRRIDYLLPVPLHRKKLRARGYNQAKVLADGLSKGLGIPVLEAIVRTEHTKSQTRKRTKDRVDNVMQVFAVPDPEALRNKHVLIVDDVLTTGATIEGCARHLLDIPGIKISAVTLAMAQR